MTTLTGITLQTIQELVDTGLPCSDEVLLGAISVFNSPTRNRYGELNLQVRISHITDPEKHALAVVCVDETRVAIEVKNVWLKPGVGIIGDVHVLDTLAGKVLKEMLAAEVAVKYRIRQVGWSDPDSPDVVSKLNIIAFDIEI